MTAVAVKVAPIGKVSVSVTSGVKGKDGINGTGAVNSVNGEAGDVVLTPANIGAATSAQGAKADTAVQPTRMINSKPLSADITLAAADVGAATTAQGAKADSAVQPARKVSTAAGSGLSGGGDLSTDRSLAVAWGTTSGTSAQGNDSRFSGVPVTTQTAAYTLVAADAGSIVEVNSASAVNVTVPASTFSAGQIVEICQIGAGQVTIVAGSGVTLRNANGLKTAKQYSSVSIRFRSATEAVVSGDTAA